MAALARPVILIACGLVARGLVACGLVVRGLVCGLVARRLVACGLVVCPLVACERGPEVHFDVRSADSDDTFAIATRWRLRVERGSEVVAEREEAQWESLRFDELPYGAFRLRLDAFVDDFVVGRGYSYPFEVEPGGVRGDPSILVGRLGRVTPTGVGPLDSEVRGVAPTALGARVVTASGRALELVVHASPERFEPALVVLAETTPHASWTDVGDALVGFGGDGDGIWHLAADVTHEEVPTGNQRYGATLVPTSRGVVVVGGAPVRFGGATKSLSRLVATERGTAVEPGPELPCATRDVPVGVLAPTAIEPGVRLVTVCGDALASTRFVLLDLARGALGELVIDGDWRRAAMGEIVPGVLVVVGGAEPDGRVSDRVLLLSATDGRLAELSPRADPLFVGRRGAGLWIVRPGLAFVTGGVSDAGEPLAASELVAFPSGVVRTGNLPVAASAPRVTRLADETLLVADARGLAVYHDPRSD